MADDRTYIRVHDGMPDHPKTAVVGGDAAWLDVCAIAWCSRNLTDGRLPMAVIPRLSDRKQPNRLALKLVLAGRWHDVNIDCPDCPSAGVGEYVIHDYLEHQRSAGEVARIREARREAGKAGGKASADSRRGGSKNEANASANGEQDDGKTEPSTETEESSYEASRPAAPPRTDVERICKHLVEVMVANDFRPPTITAKWRTEARLLIDKDRRVLDEILQVIDWVWQDKFWKGNIQSVPKLREKYDQLRLKSGIANTRQIGSSKHAWATR